MPSKHINRDETAVFRRLVKRILDRQPICQVCGFRFSCEVDHIIPLFAGGTNDWNNLQGICKSCHLEKTKSEVKNHTKTRKVFVGYSAGGWIRKPANRGG